MTTTVVLGASDKPDRFSYRAIIKLLQHGFKVIPVALRAQLIERIKTVNDLSLVSQPVDTVTIYLRPGLLTGEIEKIIQLNPRRVIFNPGTESTDACHALQKAGIEVINDCTLVMLDSGNY